MASFSKMAVFPAGYFRAFSRWLLQNRRDVAARVATMSAEIARIGFVRVLYGGAFTADGDLMKTERRTGFAVTEGSTIARLVQAYIAGGGNPWDISSFMYPDSTAVEAKPETEEEVVQQEYPGGGVVAPLSADYQPTNVTRPGESGYESDPGGHASTTRYYPDRIGGRIDPGIFDHDAVVKSMHMMRKWANQDIKERLLDIEWRIVKQADLREQLIQERDVVLVQAFGGVLSGLPELFDNELFPRSLMVQNLVQDMYALLFELDETGAVASFKANSDTGFTYFTFSAEAEEVRDSLGG